MRTETGLQKPSMPYQVAFTGTDIAVGCGVFAEVPVANRPARTAVTNRCLILPKHIITDAE